MIRRKLATFAAALLLLISTSRAADWVWTTAYHIRMGEFPEDQLSVYLTVRRYGSLEPGESFDQALQHLFKTCRDLVDNYMLDGILRPLQETIALN